MSGSCGACGIEKTEMVKKKGRMKMKKITKIVSLAMAAMMAASASASAMTFNEPMSFEITPESFYNRGYQTDTASGYSCYGWGTAMYGDKYYDNGYIPAATDENPNPEKIIDTFDGKTKYAHFPADENNTGFQLIRTLHQWNGDANTSSNYVGSFGKTRYEVIFRMDDTRDWEKQFPSDWYSALSVQQEYIDSNNQYNSIDIAANWPITNDANEVLGYWLAYYPKDANAIGVGQLFFNEWYRMRIDVDVQSKTFDFILDKYRDDQSGQVDNVRKETYQLSDIACATSARFRWDSILETMDFGGLKITRDSWDIKDLTVDDTSNASNVQASVKIANNAPANDCEMMRPYPIANEWASRAETMYTYDNCNDDTLYKAKTTSPTLILAQYDASGRLIGLNSKSEEIPTLNWGYSETAKSAAADANFAYKTISFDVPKEANYSYAKVYLWNNINEIVPFAAAVGTQAAPVE